MSNQDPFAFGKFIPGFDFLQQLAGSGSAMPGAAARQWVAPTVDVDELDRRVTELKAVQFWLEQNLVAVKATIQALEVQKMTLQTLQSMDLSMAEVARAFTIPPIGATSEADDREQDAPQEPVAEPKRTESDAPDSTAQAGAGLADPMQWWGALTQQFQQIALQTMQDVARAMPADADAGEGKKPAAKKKASGTKSKAGAAKKKPAAKRTAAKRGKTSARKTAASRKKADGWPLPTGED